MIYLLELKTCPLKDQRYSQTASVKAPLINLLTYRDIVTFRSRERNAYNT